MQDKSDSSCKEDGRRAGEGVKELLKKVIYHYENNIFETVLSFVLPLVFLNDFHLILPPSVFKW